MPQLPKDPQQLAQDILAGRVSIQQLQAEQARRREEQEALRRNMRTRPAASSDSGRQPGNRQVVKPAGRPSQPPGRQLRQSAKVDSYAAGSAANAKRSPSKSRAAAAQADAASDAKTSPSPTKTSPAAAAKPAAVSRTTSQTVRAVMNNPHALRSVFILSELLDKPLSLRQDPVDRL